MKKFKIADLPWSESHGYYSYDKSPGLTLLYLGVLFSTKARNILIIGSGAGFIPMLFSQNTSCEIFVVDAQLPDSGSGSPHDVAGNSFYENMEGSRVVIRDRVTLMKGLSADFLDYCKSKELFFDCIFIDGDHSEVGFRSDLYLSLKCLDTEMGVLICHDANQPTVRSVLSESGLEHVVFKMAAGCAVVTPKRKTEIDENASRTLMSLSYTERNKKEISDTLENSDARRWDYLASEVFTKRLDYYLQMMKESLLVTEIVPSEVIEIGGNPSSFLKKLMSENFWREARYISVEPYISPVAQKVFLELASKGVEVINTLENLSISGETNIVIALGIDLSLSPNFSALSRDFSQLLELIQSPGYLLIEFPDYEPSRKLAETLVFGLELVRGHSYEFSDDKLISLNQQFLRRNLRIYKKSSRLKQDKKKIDEFLIYYGKYHAIPGTPNGLSQSLPLAGESAEIFSNFNSYPMEYAAEIGNFVWLKPKQKIRFPQKMNQIEFELAWSLPKLRRWVGGLLITIDDKTLRFSRILSKKEYLIGLDFFIPSRVDGTSRDKRQLSYPVKKYTFIKKNILKLAGISKTNLFGE